MRQALEDAIAQLRKHRAIAVSDVKEAGEGCTVEVNVEVALPSRAQASGISATLVRSVEPCQIVFSKQWPLQAPEFLLRNDFPLNLPHVNPHVFGEKVNPCLFEGSLDEVLHRFGLDRLIDQLVDWLGKAAAGTLIDPEHGWEPTRRDVSNSCLLFSAERAIRLTPNDGTLLVTRGQYVAIDGEVFTSIDSAFTVGGVRFTHTLDDSKSLPIGRGECSVIFARAVDANSQPAINSIYQPESVSDIDSLLTRARELGVREMPLTEALNKYYLESVSDCTINPASWTHGVLVMVVFLVQRPTNLVGAPGRNVELLPYVVRWRPGKNYLAEKSNTVEPAFQLLDISPQLLAQSAGIELPQPSPHLVIAGCGSLGSKVALHLGRSGMGNMTFVDEKYMQPHNSARHALIRPKGALYVRKVDMLRDAFRELSHESTKAIRGDIVELLAHSNEFKQNFPEQNLIFLDTTASLKVLSAEIKSEALSAQGIRVIRSVLYGQGKCVVLALEGSNRATRVDDLFACLFEVCRQHPRLRQAIAGNQSDPVRLFIGDNCSTMTMPMPDSRISRGAAMTAEQIQVWLTTEMPEDGVLACGIEDASGIGMSWRSITLSRTTVLNVEAEGGWEVRVLHHVCANITSEAKHYGARETGGVLMGRVDMQTRTIVLAGLVPAPPDSKREKTKFVLGTDGLVQAVTDAYTNSLGHLSYVGTWHSHPMGGKHSDLDLSTLEVLADKAKGAPVVSLIWTKEEFYCTVRVS